MKETQKTRIKWDTDMLYIELGFVCVYFLAGVDEMLEQTANEGQVAHGTWFLFLFSTIIWGIIYTELAKHIPNITSIILFMIFFEWDLL